MNPMAPGTPERDRTIDPKPINDEYRREADTEFAPILDAAGNPIGGADRDRIANNLLTELREYNTPYNEQTIKNLKEARKTATRNALRRILTRFLHGVAKRVVELGDPRKQAFFAELAKYNLDDSTMAYLYELLVKYSDNANPITISPPGVGVEPSPFERDLLTLQGASPDLFEIVIKVLQRPAILNALGINQPGIPEKLTNYLTSAAEAKKEIENQRGVEMDAKRRASFEEQINLIKNAYRDAQGDRAERLSEIMDYLYTSDPETLANIKEIPKATLENNVRNSLTNIVGIPAGEVDTLFQLAKEFKGGGGLDYYLSNYASDDIKTALNDFKEDVVFDRLFIRKTDGTYMMNEKSVDYFRNQVRKMVNSLFRKVDENPNADFRDMFNDLVEGNILRSIADKFYQLSSSSTIQKRLSNSPEVQTEFYNFIRRGLIQEIYLERNHRELYHNIVYIFSALTPDKWGSALARINISELGTLTRDKVINQALELWKNYLQELLIQNDNKIPPNLLGGRIKRRSPEGTLLPEQQQVYSFRERDEFMKRLDDQLRLTGRIPEKWELERAYSLVRGLSALTMEMTAILSNAEVTESYESIPLADLIAKHNPRFLWGWGRGGRPELMKTAAIYMFKMNTQLDKRAFWQKFGEVMDNRWIPTEANRKGKEWENQLENVDLNDPDQFNKMINNLTQYIFDHDTTWFRLMQKVSMGDWLSQGSWRIYGIKEVYKEFYPGKEWGTDWPHIYRFFRDHMGVVAGFTTYSNDRAKDETLRQIDIALGKKGVDAPARKRYIEDLRRRDDIKSEDFSAWESERRNSKVIDGVYMNGGRVNDKLNYNQFYEHRLDAIRGGSFYDLLMKDPLAFLNNLNQLMPELQEGKVRGMSAGDFYIRRIQSQSGDVWRQNGLEPSDKDKWGKFRNYFGERFTTVTGTEESQRLMAKIMDFYTQLYDEMGVYAENLEPGESDRRKKLARDTLFKYLTAAHAKAAAEPNPDPNNPLTGRGTIRETDIVALDPKNQEEVRRADMVKRLLFAQDTGLLTVFRNHIRDFGGEVHFGNGKENLGFTDHFFHRLAYTWWRRNNISVVPNGDLNHNLLFRAIDASGEDQFFRTYGAFDALSKVQSEVMKLYSRLKRASVKEGAPLFDTLEDILKVHTTIKELEPHIGQQAMREIQYYVATVVGHYFQQHWAKRMPIIGNFVGQLELGKTTSLSKLFYGPRAPEFTSDQLREYARWLQKEGCINSKGMWSTEMFLREVASENSRFWMTEFIPNWTTYLALFILFEYIKEAFKEEVDTGGPQKK